MIIEYVGVSEINGSLIVLDGVKGASYEEIVTIKLADGSARQGRIVQIEGERIVVQVFEGTSNISLDNTATILTGRPMEMPLSPEIVGRILDGAGRPIDGLGPIYPETRRDINGTAINPVSRVYPRNYINTGISSIDTLSTLIRGQKLPIFSGSGMKHNELAVPAQMRATSALCSRRWASRMTLRNIFAAALKKRALCSMSPCSSISPMIRSSSVPSRPDVR